MADSMCGPSNPLQNFQKHSTVDRTLQQDRLVSKPSPSEGFRSSPGPNGGIVNQEFEAFQAGQLPLDHGFQHQQFPLAQAGVRQAQAGPSGWASDFQRLNISSPSQFQQQPYSPQAQQRHDTGGWHQDFARQQGGMAEQRMGQMQGQANSPYRYSPMSGMSMTSQYTGGFTGPQAEMSIAQQKQPAETFDDEAFARAFEAAAQAEMESKQETSQKQEASQEQNVEMGQDIMINESAERLMANSEGLLDQQKIGADSIHNPLAPDPKAHQEMNSPDALARTAGQLLDSVRHDQSSKFQNSQFLQLMRQFRDKEAVVEGDKIVGINRVRDGNGNEVMAGGEEAIKDEIALLSKRLISLVLDKKRPFVRTPQNVSNLLHTLLHLSLLLTKAQQETLYLHRKTLSRIQFGIYLDPVLQDLSSIQDLASTLQVRAQRANKAAAMRNARGLEVRRADSVIELLRIDGERDVVGEWVEECLVEREMEAMCGIVRYTLPEKIADSTFEILKQRVNDILGPDVLRVKEACKRRGIWCRELGSEEFLGLVERYREVGESKEFVEAVRRVERMVEERDVIAGERTGFSRSILMRAKRKGYRLAGKEEWLEDGSQEETSKNVGTGYLGIQKGGKEGGVAGELNPKEEAEEMRDMAEESVGRVKTRDLE